MSPSSGGQATSTIRPTPGRRAAVVAILLALTLVVAACSGGGKKAAPTTSTTAASTSSTAAPALAPLTGLPTTDPGVTTRPALVVKLDNADGVGPTARPQLGINQADVVYEEMVEGSVTRLAAIFQSQVPGLVGPVRSAWATDVSVVEPLHQPLYAWSGGNGPTVALIHAAALHDVGYDAQPKAYQRRNAGNHVAPHNLYTAPPALFASAAPGEGPPPALFTYRPAGAAPTVNSPAVRSIHITFGNGPGSAPVDWFWDAAQLGFDRVQKGTAHLDEAGRQIVATNVVVMFVGYSNTGLTDVAGNAVPKAELQGTGTCWVLTGGHLVQGSWSKPSPSAVTTYTDAAGAPIALAPGATWVELAPPGSASQTAG